MIRTTLLELVDMLTKRDTSEADLLRQVVELVNGGTVVLTGNFRGQTFRLDDPAFAA